MSVKGISLKHGLLIIGLSLFIVAAIFIGCQFYFSYVEVTEAANTCFNSGGFPIIEKSGLEMTYFECVPND